MDFGAGRIKARAIAADSSTGTKTGECSGGRRGKATGGTEVPPQVGACFVFIIITGLLLELFDP